MDIPGALPVAWDQPRINAALIRPGESDPIYDVLIGDFNFRGFLDTGATGIILDDYYSCGPGFDLPPYQYDATTVVFSDVGVGGATVDYNVTESLELRLGADHLWVYLNDLDTFDAEYDQSAGPGRLLLGPVPGDCFPTLFGTLNVIGMPAMIGKVMVVDPKYVDLYVLNLLSGLDPNFIEQLHTYLYPPGTTFIADAAYTDPGIPVTDRHVQLTMVDVSRFTQIVPGPDPGPPPDPGAELPALANNPFIGPNPVNAIDPSVPAGTTPGITLTYGANSATGSFLFDTGAAISMISQATAAQLNVRYRDGTYGTDSPVLETFDPANPSRRGTTIPDQFKADITGVGGTVTIAGFYIDSLLVRTLEGNAADDADPNHLRYTNSAVYVYDITVTDPNAAPPNDTLTLDGIFGMNMLVASSWAIINPFPIPPTILDTRLAPFEWIVFDEPNARIGLKISPSADNDYDDDGVPDDQDNCPFDANTAQTNSDSDFPGDACDAFPTDSNEYRDTDGDGTGDEADADDDNDGINDVDDKCPLTYDPGQENNEPDAWGDACDPDDDNDGAADPRDAFPFDASEHLDTDGDGTGNNADTDDDNDGLSDLFELANALNPLDPSDCPWWICGMGSWRYSTQTAGP